MSAIITPSSWVKRESKKLENVELKGCKCSIDIEWLYLEALKRGDTAIYDPEGLIVCEMKNERKVIPISEIKKREEDGYYTP